MSRQNVDALPGVRIALSPLSEGAGRRRSLEQRLIVHAPALYRRLAAAFMRLPPQFRLRRVMLARSVRLAYRGS